MKIYKIFTLIFLCVFIFMNNAHSENATWTGAVSTAWNNPNNWSHLIVPSYNDSVNLVSKPNSPILNDTITLKRFKITGGTFNLNGKTLTINVNSEFSGGTITNGKVITRGSFTFFQGTIFNCPVDARTGQVQLNGGKYNYPVYIEQNGAATGPGSGNNVFNDSATIRNTGTGYLRMAMSQPDTFNTTATFFNSGNYNLQISYTASTIFNGDVYISNTNIGGISTNTNGTGVTSLASGKTLKISSTGFTNGTLLLRNFYQHGTSAPDSIVLGTSATLNIIGSTFESAQDFTAPSILSKTSTYGSTTFRKTANAGNYWDGGNTFNGTANIYCNSTTMAGYSMSIQQPNIFNADANFYTTTGVIQVVNSGITEMKGNCSINNSLITFNNGSGKLKFTGSIAQTLSGSAAYTFGHVIIDKATNGITINQSSTVDSTFIFTKGIITVSTGNTLTYKASSTVSGACAASFISGAVKKIGNTAFTFPIGKGNEFRLMLELLRIAVAHNHQI